MRNRLKNIFNSSVSEISMLVIVCCMITTNVSIKANGAWTDIAVGSSIVGGVVLFGLLIWATYKLIARKEVLALHYRRFIIRHDMGGDYGMGQCNMHKNCISELLGGRQF